jgi:hypothetical protein
LLVKDFQNKPLTECPEGVMSEVFLTVKENVAQFCDRIYSLSPRAAHEAFQKMLMSDLATTNVGIYSTFHDNCVAVLGYEHPESIRLACMYVNIHYLAFSSFINNDYLSVATVLDASKTGYQLRSGILETDRKAYWNQKPSNSDSFILTRLKVAAEKKGGELLAQHREAGPKLDEYARPDHDLSSPYDAAANHANEVFRVTNKSDWANELALIRKHVDLAQKAWTKATAKNLKAAEHPSPSTSKKSSRIKSDQEDLTLNAARQYADPIKDILLTRNVEEVKASFAYRSNRNFAFSVAFNQLCVIKARASSEGIAPSLRSFDEGKSLTASFLRTLTCCED